MKLYPKISLEPVDPDHFTGDVLAGIVLEANQDEGLRVYRVTFPPGGRTAWHLHTGVQLLFVEEGKGLVQKEGEAVLEIGPGDAIHIAPGEKHWHGACPEESMSHLAVNIGGPAEWMEKVSEEEYTRSSRTP